MVIQEKKLKENHAWFLDTVNLFKPPNPKSREALDAKQVKMGSRELRIQSELKDAALKTSSILVILCTFYFIFLVSYPGRPFFFILSEWRRR